MRRLAALLLLLATPAWAQPAPGQGWTASEREIFWNSPVGSRLIPYEWFGALEQPGGEALFADPGHLATYGTLPSPANPANPDGLPIGLSRERVRADGFWLGMSCAACHTRRIAYQGSSVIVDGGRAMLDPQAFDRALSAALAGTAGDPARFARFADRLRTPEPDRAALQDRLAQVAAARTAATAMNAAPDPAGPGRLDLRGTLANAVTAIALAQPGNASPPAAPIRMPQLWGGTEKAPLLRDIAQVLASGGTVELGAPPPYPGSPSLFDLVKIEALLRKLEPPPWPAMLPPIDAAAAERGRAVFARTCAGCHAASATIQVAADQVGTDRAALQPRPLAATGALQGRPVAPGGLAFGAQAPPAVIVGHVVAGLAAQMPRLPHEAALPAPRVDAYPAGPLAGIWAGAPYLHNGAVPNLWQLLTPAAQRVPRFSLAPGDLDPVDVGLPTQGVAPPLFDTGRPGNANTGHEFGTTLPEAVKRDLVEFLKAL